MVGGDEEVAEAVGSTTPGVAETETEDEDAPAGSVLMPEIFCKLLKISWSFGSWIGASPGAGAAVGSANVVGAVSVGPTGGADETGGVGVGGGGGASLTVLALAAMVAGSILGSSTGGAVVVSSIGGWLVNGLASAGGAWGKVGSIIEPVWAGAGAGAGAAGISGIGIMLGLSTAVTG